VPQCTVGIIVLRRNSSWCSICHFHFEAVATVPGTQEEEKEEEEGHGKITGSLDH